MTRPTVRISARGDVVIVEYRYRDALSEAYFPNDRKGRVQARRLLKALRERRVESEVPA